MRTKTKRHSVPRLKRGGNYIGYGKLVPDGDAHTGDPLPYTEAVKNENGNWVFRDFKKGSRDRPKTW